MVNNSEVFNQIAFSLAKHYECVYYVNLDTNHYIVFTDSEATGASEFPSEGDDFFADCLRNADKFIHPDDINLMTETYEKEIMLKTLMKEGSQRVIFRALNDGKMSHMRHIVLLCDDKKHMVCCLENIEKEYLEKERQKKNLLSAELMARRDELTGVKNNHAFKEYVNYIRLHKAIQMLLTTDDSITKIALACGFNSSNYFKDCFHKSFNISPREYRKLRISI